MRKVLLVVFVLVSFNHLSVAQLLPNYYSQTQYLMTSPGAFQQGLLGFVNPANLTMLKSFESRFVLSTDENNLSSIQNWGIFAASRQFGFGVLQEKYGNIKTTRYRIGSSFGDYGNSFGFSYTWGKVRDSKNMENFVTAGWLMRPNRFLSFGLIGDFSTASTAWQSAADIGIRPFGSDQITLFADAAWRKGIKIKESPWSAGVVLRIVQGIYLTGRYFNDKAFTVGFSMDFGNSGISGQTRINKYNEEAFKTFSSRVGGPRPSFFTGFKKGKSYLPLNLRGKVDYHKYVLFDRSTHRFLDLLNSIRNAADDPRIGAIALNLSSVSVRPEHAWELREELLKFRQQGKKVIAFVDNADMTIYHLASVADKIVMDPEGILMLEGYVLGRTYLKGTLEKLGLGFDEWRFFKYKSAYESYSREKMSQADREQRQDYVDDWYELVRGDVCASRKMKETQFDKLIDDDVLFVPEAALTHGLIDTLGRWSAVQDILKKLIGKNMAKKQTGQLLAVAQTKPEWGARPKIALVYALGECAMDTGIKGRWLERVFLHLAKDDNIRAVVFRVDSPGGDVLASDLVAEALKKCSEKKPVIISQGQVAGSGGYWISMYGDTILAGPNTVTGSIGVIGGWIYDKGFSGKMGLTADHVQRGEHADLLFGPTLPLLGIRIPGRNLTPPERARIERMIKDIYEIFVSKVARGRDMRVKEVKEIAQGHFYSGTRGKQIGLVDEIGGLTTALSIARQKAGIQPDQDIQLIELPKSRGLFNMDFGLPSLKTQLDDDPVIRYLKMVSKNPYKPLLMMLPGTYPE